MGDWSVLGISDATGRVTAMSDGGTPAGGGWGAVDLATIWVRSKNILDAQVEVIERAVVAGIQRRLDACAQGNAAREAHKLAGSLGTFGFHEGTRLARALELALATDEALDPGEALGLSRLVMELQAEMARPLTAPDAPPTADAGPTPLLVVDADADRARRVVEAAAAQGLATEVAPSLDAARELIETSMPEAVVVDAAAGELGAEGDEFAGFLSDLAARRPAVAVVVLVEQADAVERVQATRAGAWVILQKPVPPDAVVQAVSRLLARSGSAGTVLAVDDDPTFLLLVQQVLAAEGFTVESLDDAAGLWPALEVVEPDLLLLDNEMPGLDGVSLCQALRADDRWAGLPVVFLSGSGSPEVVRAMYAAGADDYVPKPLSIDDLVTRVVNRIRRSRAQSERPDVVLATGLPTERVFLDDAARLLGLARQEARPAVLAVAHLEPPTPSAVAAFGRRLRQAAAPEDGIGTWSGGRVAALLYGLCAAEAEDRLSRVLRAARATGVDAAPAVAIGIAAAPDDGDDLRSLGPAAEAALARALAAGGDAVVVQESPGRRPTEVVDVLLVDDDEALGALVEHALTGRGWSVRWLRDGAEAVELLDAPGFLARPVLLDVGLPGLDGLSVLRHLGRSGRLATTRVVMLTVRTNEGEVLEALDLGAFDHVAKPFSLSVLIHRVRRAVEG